MPAPPGKLEATDAPLPTGEETTPLGSVDEVLETDEPTSLEPLRQRYDILEELGRGGMGVVYRARDRETGDIVALKVLRTQIAGSTAALERFRNELLLARKITHKNVCRTYELLRFGELAAIAMEYVEGDSLRTILRRAGAIGVSRGLEWSRQICAGLAEAHACGVVHRDLKPENVVVDGNGVVKIMDFGIARSLDGGITTRTGAVIGTPAYMAPEQAEGKRADERADIYALGLVLYEIFAGQQAFRGETPMALAYQQVHATPTRPRTLEPYLPAFLERCINRCLEKDPAKRFRSVAEVEAALSETQAAPQAVALPQHLRTASWRDALLLALGAVGLVVYFALVARIDPGAAVRVALTRGQFLEKARQDMRTRGWEPGSGGRLQATDERNTYRALAEKTRRAGVRAGTAASLPPVLLRVSFDAPEAAATKGADSAQTPNVVYEPNGTLRSLELPVEGWIARGPGLSRDQALDLAKREMQQSFGIDVSGLALESEGTLEREGRQGRTLTWKQPPAGELEWHYKVEVYDRLTYLGRWTTVPGATQRSSAPTIIGLLWFAGVILIFVGARLFAQIEVRKAGVFTTLAVIAVVGLAAAWDVGDLFYLWVFALYAAAFGFWLVVTDGTTTFLARRPWPHLTVTFGELVELRRPAPATALGIARGCACGLALLGAQAALLWIFIAARLISPEPSPLFALTSRVPALTIVATTMISTFSLTYGFASTASLAARWTRSALVFAAIGGLTAFANSPFALPPAWVRVGIVVLTGAVLCWVLLAYDLLTAMVTVFTFFLWQRAWPLVLVLESVGNWQYWLVLLLWAGALGWAVIAGYRALWTRALARASEALR